MNPIRFWPLGLIILIPAASAYETPDFYPPLDVYGLEGHIKSFREEFVFAERRGEGVEGRQVRRLAVTFDPRGNVTEVVEEGDGYRRADRMTYQEDRLVKEEIAEDGRPVKYALYRYHANGDLVLVEVFAPNHERLEETVLSYNIAGRLLSEQTYHGEALLSAVQYEYEERGNRTRMREFDQNGRVAYEWAGVYDEAGHLVSEEEGSDEERIKRTYTFEDDGVRTAVQTDGRLLEEAVYDPEGLEREARVYVYEGEGLSEILSRFPRYDAGGRPVLIDHQNRLGDLVGKDIFVYNERNDRNLWIHRNRADRVDVDSEATYRYDKQGNWTERVEETRLVTDADPVVTTRRFINTRTIEYYEATTGVRDFMVY